MDYFVSLDVGVEDTALCVVDGEGGVLLQCEVPTDPQAIAEAVRPYRKNLRRAGHEAGALSPWLQAELLALGLPVLCVEARHAKAAMSAQRNKTDAADALGLAHIMRTGWFKRAHMKAEGTYRLRLLLTHRRNLKRKFLDIENAIRHSLKTFGIRIKGTGRAGFEKRIRELIGTMLDARAGLSSATAMAFWRRTW